MSVTALKSEIHKIVDQIQNEQLLVTMYDFLKVRQTDASSSSWESLSEMQKREVLEAFEESEVESNLLSREEVFQKG